MLGVTTAVFLLVVCFTGIAVFRGRRQRRDVAGTPNTALLNVAVSSAVAVTTAVLFGLLAASVWTGRAVAAPGAPSALSISITGHQWWWEVEYEDAIPSRRLKAANEIHIPTGRPVVFKVTSRDVIHSFWVPNLQGKRDLIPGYTTAIWLQADHAGVYRGQCAEFCGLQHAHMAFQVVAESSAEFERWIDAQRSPSRQPQTESERRGRTVFLTRQCSMCHAIRGTDAYGTVGPDLTHVASRQTIAAGTLPNTRGHLAGWVVDSQAIKPGNRMPPNPLSADDLQDLLAYLEALK